MDFLQQEANEDPAKHLVTWDVLTWKMLLWWPLEVAIGLGASFTTLTPAGRPPLGLAEITLVPSPTTGPGSLMIFTGLLPGTLLAPDAAWIGIATICLTPVIGLVCMACILMVCVPPGTFMALSLCRSCDAWALLRTVGPPMLFVTVKLTGIPLELEEAMLEDLVRNTSCSYSLKICWKLLWRVRNVLAWVELEFLYCVV